MEYGPTFMCNKVSHTRKGLYVVMQWMISDQKLARRIRCTHSTETSGSHTVVLGISLQLRHNERDGVSNHQPPDCLLNRLFRRRSKKTLKLRVTGLCEGNSLVSSEFSAQRFSNAENVSVWWHHHDICQQRRNDSGCSGYSTHEYGPLFLLDNLL